MSMIVNVGKGKKPTSARKFNKHNPESYYSVMKIDIVDLVNIGKRG
jgi:hypothetical protein